MQRGSSAAVRTSILSQIGAGSYLHWTHLIEIFKYSPQPASVWQCSAGKIKVVTPTLIVFLFSFFGQLALVSKLDFVLIKEVKFSSEVSASLQRQYSLTKAEMVDKS